MVPKEKPLGKTPYRKQQTPLFTVFPVFTFQIFVSAPKQKHGKKSMLLNVSSLDSYQKSLMSSWRYIKILESIHGGLV